MDDKKPAPRGRGRQVKVSPPAPRRKNRAVDDRFIEAHAGEFKIYEGKLQWSGLSVDVGSEYQLPPDERRCHHLTPMKDGDGQPILGADYQPLLQRCFNWSMIRAGICVQHAKGSEAVKNAVRHRILGAADALVGEMIDLALNKAADDSDRIRAINSLLDRGGIRGGVEVGPEVKGWQEVLKSMMEDGPDEPSS